MKLLEIPVHRSSEDEMLAADPDFQRNMKITQSTGKMLVWDLKLSDEKKKARAMWTTPDKFPKKN